MNITTKFNVGDKVRYKFTVTTQTPVPCAGGCIDGKVNADFRGHLFPVQCPVCKGNRAYNETKRDETCEVVISSVRYCSHRDSFWGDENINYGFTGCRNANVAGESKLEAIA